MAHHSDWLSAHAVDADLRKHAVEREAPRHYLDRDAPALACLDTLGAAPWFDRAVRACTEDTLWAYGVLPWQIQWSYRRLVEAFDSRDRDAILRSAADLGHYVADAHVPLHTTLNYNGQLTGQQGIHALWETRLPELYGDGYALWVDEVLYVSDVGAWAWTLVMSSHGLVEHVLEAETKTTAGWDGDGYVREARGNAMQLQRVEPWCFAYHAALDGMVEKQWRMSVAGVAALWYSAWVDAGSPDLSDALAPESRRRGTLWHRVRNRVRSTDDRPVP